MEQPSDMELAEHNGKKPGASVPFSNVTFYDVQELYTIDSPVTVHFTTSSPELPNPNDHIALFRIGWLTTRDYIGLFKILSEEDTMSEQNPSSKWSVTFNAKELTLEDGEFYQFCYLTESSEVQGVSIPFQFVMDDFEIVPDLSQSEQQPAESFVHAEHPEVTTSMSLIQSELVCSEPAVSESAEAPSQSQRVSELEEALSRAHAEIMSCRQENEMLQLKLHSVEADSGKENTKLRNDIETLMRERDEKKQLADDLTTRVRDLEAQLVAEMKKLAEFDVSFNALQDAKQNLASRCTNLTKEKSRLEDECTRLTKDNENLCRSVAELTSKLEQQADDTSKEKQVACVSMDTMEQQPPSKVRRDENQLTADDGRWLDQQLSVGGTNTQSAAASSHGQASYSTYNPSAPNLMDANGQNYAAAPSYGLIGPAAQPVQQAPLYPCPYPVPPTWFPNPYVGYVPEAYRTVGGYAPGYH